MVLKKKTKKGKKLFSTYHRPHKSLLILLVPLDCVLGIPRPLDQLSNSIARLALRRRAGSATHRTDIVQDTAQLVRGWRGGGHFELELAALLLGVRGVVGGLVFSGGFRGGDGRLFEDVEDAGGGGEGGRVEEGDWVEGFTLSKAQGISVSL